jgi:putative DNA primase/helicase
MTWTSDQEHEVFGSADPDQPEPPADAGPFPLSDLGNAERLVAAHGRDLRHVAGLGWHIWSGTHWQRDDTGEVQRRAKATARSILHDAANCDDDSERKQIVKWARTSEAEPRLRAAVTLAASEQEVVVRVTDLDANPFLLAATNGTIDLRSGDLRLHDPADLITSLTEIAYDATANCPRWERFLREVFADDEELVAFVQRFAGYALTGDTREHVLIVLHGAGRNGKSTLLRVQQRLLGEQAVTAALETFLRARGDRGPRNDLARLHRARLVSAAESGEGRKLDEATVKELTGGDRVAARFLYGEHFEFIPRFKLAIVTNHRPRIDGDDDAIWARLRLVPFEVCFEGREDRELPELLDGELPGILAWAVRGCLDWQRDGLGQAGAVARATAAYRADEDVLGAFLDERCNMQGDVEVVAFRSAYDTYCQEVGEKPLPANVLGKRLARREIQRHKRDGTYRGVSLR